ncbi:hypothetical protein [Helicobacter fennelliae]|uniref:hypothetical protein n=1 Tax=Helicobacter fennelliae TaxID=215 RepID=UPI000E1747A0|nr:hypothetical protein [Helicobacter fennelliae]STP07717.1 Uncharacterised protein [Helicobacter fennelliae]
MNNNTINLNQEEQKELKGLYAKLSNLYKERAKLEVLKKDREENLKEEIASACNIINKQGETQSSKVKMPLVNAILDELYRDKPNKEEIKASTMEDYKLAINNKEVNEDCIKSYISSDESIKENNDSIKEVYKESSILSKEILDALNALLKDEYKLHLNDELVKGGYEIKETKGKEELLELKELIKKLVG